MRSALVPFLVLALACGPGWKRAELGPATRLPPEQHVQVWSSDGSEQVLHAVQVDAAGVSGVPWPRPGDCVSCRVVVPRGKVDSVRLGDLSGRQIREVGTWWLLLFAFVGAVDAL